MVVTRTRRLINPQRAKRKLSPKQIRIFGTARQKAALKRSRSAKRAARPIARRKPLASRPRRRAANPATLLTIGALNPQRSNTMATKKRRRTTKAASTTHRRRRRVATAANPTRRRTAASNPRKRTARRNGTKIYVMRRNRHRNGSARRNPEVFGLTGASAGKAILAGLVGVYATKTITPMIGSAVPQVGSSSMIGAVISAVVAWGGGHMLSKWDKTAGAGFMFGGLMQAGSQLLNQFVTPNPLSLSGLGDFAPAVFAVPENPIRRAALARAQMALPAPAPANANLSGMGAAAQFH